MSVDVASTQFGFHIMRMQTQVRSAIVGAVFHKALTLHPESACFFSGGQITNLFSGTHLPIPVHIEDEAALRAPRR